MTHASQKPAVMISTVAPAASGAETASVLSTDGHMAGKREVNHRTCNESIACKLKVI
jgi:hypothetical protein